uniref:(northern house mosquito) hypothetical protein n=1 Tax=Culex pipiens TaxID=7175 RepID=A0A8D8MSL0_CULPI
MAAVVAAAEEVRLKLPLLLLLTECAGEGFGRGGIWGIPEEEPRSSIGGVSSQMASTRAKLYMEEALSKEDPSSVTWALPAAPPPPAPDPAPGPDPPPEPAVFVRRELSVHVL